jgi:multiple sugar transport system permease protein
MIEQQSAGRKREGLSLGQREAAWAYLFLVIPLGFFLFVRVWPAFHAFSLSIQKWHADPAQRQIIGFDNYVKMVGDIRLRRALLNTVKYTLLGVPLQLGLGLLIALGLHSISRWKTFFRALYFVPYITPAVGIAWVWSWILAPNFGFLNWLLTSIGLKAQLFLSSPTQALPSVTAVVIWQHIGYQVVLFLAGLAGISKMYYEAAEIDGASRWQTFRYVTLPLLNNVIVFSVVITTILYLQLFALVVNLKFSDQGGPLDSTLSLALYIYQQAFHRFKMGYAAAVTVLFFIIILLVTLIQMRLISREEEF